MYKIVFSLLIFLSIILKCPGQGSASVIVNGRWGSENIPLFLDEYGNKVTLSTGSGISAGGEYSYDFSWLFSLSADVMMHYSSLTESAENASGHFIGMETHITPSLTLPAREDPPLKVLAGAGPGLYTFGTIKVFAKGAGGENMTFKYNPALGWHAQLLFKIRFHDQTYITLGARYYLVSYSFKEKGSTHYTNAREINKPDGSGIGLYFSIGGRL